jgi:hypothetical protein
MGFAAAWKSEIKLVDDLMAAKPRVTYFDREHLGEELHAQFLDRLRELAGTAVIETIDYWMKSLADGNDGEFPEFCFEFPYPQRCEDIDALTVAYCVDNEDGTRTELNRVTLERVLMQLLKNDPPAHEATHQGNGCQAERLGGKDRENRSAFSRAGWSIIGPIDPIVARVWSPTGELDDGAPSKWELAA